MSVCWSVVCRSFGLSICGSLGLSTCRSFGLFVCLSVSRSVCRFVGLSVCLSVDRSAGRSVRLSVYPGTLYTCILPSAQPAIGICERATCYTWQAESCLDGCSNSAFVTSAAKQATRSRYKEKPLGCAPSVPIKGESTTPQLPQ